MCSPPHRSFLELTTWSFDWWDIMILILHITMTTAAHSHPPPSEISSGFFWMSVSAPSKYPSPAQAVKEEQILYYISLFFFGLSPSQSIYELKEAKPNVVKDAFFLVWSLSMFFFFFHMQYFVRGMFWSFNALPLFQHHTRCLKRVPRKPD